jgi:hypothetical protein
MVGVGYLLRLGAIAVVLHTALCFVCGFVFDTWEARLGGG